MIHGKLLQISAKDAVDFILPRHYAGRKPAISVAFGWFINDKIVAACTFGKPASNTLCDGICGKEFSKNVFELNRLCRMEDLKLQLSEFVSACLRELSKNNWIIVSYSDTGMNHNGYIYQACNFIYTGLTKERTDKYVPNGKHSRHYHLEDQGEFRVLRTAKNRYVYFAVNDKKLKKLMLKNINYDILPYPKFENHNYILGEVYHQKLIKINKEDDVNMGEIKSPLRYPGGKNLFTKIICPLLGDFDEYREPFLGGGSIFLHLANQFPDKDFIISDKFKNLYLFWKFAKYHNEELEFKIRELKSKFQDGRELWKEVTSRSKFCSDFQKAVDFFIINRISFSGVSYCGGFSEGSFKGRFTDSSIDRVGLLKNILNSNNINILNYDYSELLRMNPKKEKSKVVIYCDPPYFIDHPKLYGKKGDIHSNFNHKRFALMMKGCRYKWLVSYNDCKEIRDLFNFANINDFEQYYPMRHNDGEEKIGKELLISNFELNG